MRRRSRRFPGARERPPGPAPGPAGEPPGDAPGRDEREIVDPYRSGLRLLGRRDFSVAALRARLMEETRDAGAVDLALARLAREGALDDRRVAATAARASAARGRGRLRILRELAAAGIAEDLARAAVDEAVPPGDEDARLERAIARHVHGPLSDDRRVRRAAGTLLRLGFPPAAVRAALRRRAAALLPDESD